MVALQSILTILNAFSCQRLCTHLFAAAWETFVTHIQDVFLLDGRAISTPALRCLERALKAVVAAMLSADAEEGLRSSFGDCSKTWAKCEEMGTLAFDRRMQLPSMWVHLRISCRRVWSCLWMLSRLRTICWTLGSADGHLLDVGQRRWPLEHSLYSYDDSERLHSVHNKCRFKKNNWGSTFNTQSLSECENYVKSYQLDRLIVEVVAQQSCSFDSDSLDLAISAKANLGYGLKLACSLSYGNTGPCKSLHLRTRICHTK